MLNDSYGVIKFNKVHITMWLNKQVKFHITIRLDKQVLSKKTSRGYPSWLGPMINKGKIETKQNKKDALKAQTL